MSTTIVLCLAGILPAQQPSDPGSGAAASGGSPSVTTHASRWHSSPCQSSFGFSHHHHSDWFGFHHHHHGHGFRSFFGLHFPRSFFCESFTTVDFFGAPFGWTWWPSFGHLSYAPILAPPVYVDPFGPRLIEPFPRVLDPLPPRLIDPRGLPAYVQPALPRDATTDIPERLVEQIIAPPRRPTLAARALGARLEGAGDLMLRSGYYARAADRYEQALGKAPDRDETRFKLAAALLAGGDYDRAAEVLRDALHRRPDWPHVDHDLVLLLPDDVAVQRTVENVENESRRAGADPDLAFLQAYLLYFSGQREAAEAIFRELAREAADEHVLVFLDAFDRRREGR